MFRIYVNDLSKALDNFSSYRCDDDFNKIMKNKRGTQVLIKPIESWIEENHMSLNMDKSKILCFNILCFNIILHLKLSTLTLSKLTATNNIRTYHLKESFVD